MLTPTSGKNRSPRHVIISEARIAVIYRVPRDRSDRGWPEAGGAAGAGARTARAERSRPPLRGAALLPPPGAPPRPPHQPPRLRARLTSPPLLARPHNGPQSSE